MSALMLECEETSDPLDHVTHLQKKRLKSMEPNGNKITQCLSVWFSCAE